MGFESRLDEYRRGLIAAKAQDGNAVVNEHERGRRDGLDQAIALLDELLSRQYDIEPGGRGMPMTSTGSIRRLMEEE
jgi:hypothetical protein